MESKHNATANGSKDVDFSMDWPELSDFSPSTAFTHRQSSQQQQQLYPPVCVQPAPFVYNNPQNYQEPINFAHNQYQAAYYNQSQQRYQDTSAPTHNPNHANYHNNHAQYENQAIYENPSPAPYRNGNAASYSSQYLNHYNSHPSLPLPQTYQNASYSNPLPSPHHHQPSYHFHRISNVQSTLQPPPLSAATPVHRASPMQGLQQLATQKHGGKLADAAAAEAHQEAAALAHKRLAAMAKRKGSKEITVRDVVKMQYLEQKRLEQAQLMHQNSLNRSDTPSSVPPSGLTTPTHASMFRPASALSSTHSHLDYPSTPSTPIFTFPLVTKRTPTPQAVSSASPESVAQSESRLPSESSSAVSSPTSLGPPDPANELPKESLSCGDSDIVRHSVANNQKTKNLMTALGRAHTQANGGAADADMTMAALHRAAKIVETVEARGRGSRTTSTSSSSSSTASSTARKRTIDQSAARQLSPPREKGVREETNENGEKVEVTYIRVYHGNVNDPDYTKEGVLKRKDEIERDKLRDDIYNITYSSVLCPYEMVDFRIKKMVVPSRSETTVPSNGSL